jgi:hypothetical protein
MADRDPLQLGPGEVVNQGRTLVQTRTPYQTAVAVLRPRDLSKVCRNVEAEAQVAGDSFYYSMTFKGKDGGKLVEGPSIEMAMCILRNFGNCAVMPDVREEEDAFFFTVSFIDLETGFNFARTKRTSKARTVYGKFDEERKMEIRYEIGQSLAIRNVALRAVPNWIVDKALAVAQDAAIEKIKKIGLVPAREKVLSFMTGHGISLDRLEKKMSKKSTGWDEKDVALLYGAMKSISDGAESATELFPPIEATGNPTPGLGDGKTGPSGTGSLAPDKQPEADPSKGGKAKR